MKKIMKRIIVGVFIVTLVLVTWEISTPRDSWGPLRTIQFYIYYQIAQLGFQHDSFEEGTHFNFDIGDSKAQTILDLEEYYAGKLFIFEDDYREGPMKISALDMTEHRVLLLQKDEWRLFGSKDGELWTNDFIRLEFKNDSLVLIERFCCTGSLST